MHKVEQLALALVALLVSGLWFLPGGMECRQLLLEPQLQLFFICRGPLRIRAWRHARGISWTPRAIAAMVPGATSFLTEPPVAPGALRLSAPLLQLFNHTKALQFFDEDEIEAVPGASCQTSDPMVELSI